MAAWDVFLSLIVLLGGALVLGALAERLGQNAIIGYLAAGMLIGPGGLGLVQDVHAVEILAEMGVALLLFTIGLEFSLARLRALGAFAVGGGLLQIGLTAALFGGGAWALGLPGRTALVVGALLAPSSTACVMRLLADRTELDSRHGRNCVGILLLQDMALVPLVLLFTLLGERGEWSRLWMQSALKFEGLVVFIGVAWGLSVLVLPRLMRATAGLRNRELLILMAATTALGAAWLAGAAGLSPALGAFIAGILLASSPSAVQLRADVATLRVLFVTLFFVSIGMLGDLGWMLGHAPSVGLLLAVILAGKAAVVAGIALFFRQSLREAVVTGLCLSQVGEFAFVLQDTALRHSLLDAGQFRLLASANLLTMVLTPFLVAHAGAAGTALQRLFPRLRGSEAGEALSSGPERDHAVVVGYGPAGRGVAAALLAQGVRPLVLDTNPRGVALALSEQCLALTGDATQSTVLEHAHLSAARVLVVTVPDHQAGLAVVRQAAALAPGLPVLARGRYNLFVTDLALAGACSAVDEEVLVGRELGRQACAYFGQATGKEEEEPPAPAL